MTRSLPSDGISPGDMAGRIQQDIAQAIYEQRMAPGTRLSETQLGDIYGVSRTVVRKALFALSADKLVDMRPNRGAAVRQPSPAEARDVFAARQMLETGLLASAMPLMRAADHQRLSACLADDSAAHEAGDRRRMIRASGDFHRQLAAPAANSVLLSFLDELIGRSSLIIAVYDRDRHGPCAQAAHRHLLDIVTAGDIAPAQKALQAHLADCLARLVLWPDPPAGGLDVLRASPSLSS